MATCPSGHQSASDDFCDVCGVLIGAAPSLAPDGAPGGAAGPAPGNGTTAAPGGAPPPSGEACPSCGAPRTGHFCESCGYDFNAAPPPGTAPPPGATPPPDVARPAPPPGQAAPPPGQVWPSAAPGPAGPPARGPDTFWPASQPSAQSAQSGAATQAGPGGPGQSAGTAVARWAALVTADRAYFDSVQAAGGPDAAGIAFPAYCPQRRFQLAGPEVRIGRHSTSSGINPEIDLSVAPADPGVSRLHAVLLLGQDGGWSVIDPGSANGTVVNGSEIPPGQPVPLRDGDRVHLGAWTELRLVREG
jgi:hypothetical protein